jgi:glycosyltransferase involved in cell wall biosynthesis
MRILISIHHELDSDSGAPGVTCRLADALRRRGHSVDILSFQRIRTPAKLKGLAYPWFVASFLLTHREYDVLDLSSGDGWVFGVLRKIGGNKMPLLVARSHGLEHLAHQARVKAHRNAGAALSWKYPIYHGGYRLWECGTSFTHADAALFLNPVDLTYAVERLGVKPQHAACIRNGIAEVFVHRAEALLQAGSTNRKPANVAFIGRYTPMKGSEVLRRAIIPLLSEDSGRKLGLFGTTIDRATILAGFPPELHEQVEVVPRYRNEDLPDLLAGYDVLAFPSLSEGFSIAPLEAMACGLVPVVSATPGPASYLENRCNGVLVPVGDAHMLQDEIAKLFNGPSEWQRLRVGALSTAARFSWDSIAAEAEQLYEAFSRRLRR